MTQSEGFQARVRWYYEQGVDWETAEAITEAEFRGLSTASFKHKEGR